MKLFFIDGKKAGQEVDLRPPGISIGRETDNDVVLEGEGASRYHAKVEWRDDAWIIRDLGSTNGTKVDGERIAEHRLKPGERVRIGQQDMLFAETRQGQAAAATAPPPVAAQPAAAVTTPAAPVPAESPMTATAQAQTHQAISGAKSFQDFFSKRDEAPGGGKFSLFGGKAAAPPGAAPQDPGKRGHAPVLFYVGVIGLAVAVVAGFLLWDLVIAPQKPTITPAATARRTPVLVIYEKQEASADNIFRFRLEIRDNVIRIEKDDLKNRIRATKEKEIGETQLENLEHFLRQTDFMSLQQPQPGVSADGRDRRRTLIVAYGRELNRIDIRNTFAPTSFEETTAIVEGFSRDVLNTPTEYLTPEEMLREGASAYAKGEELFKNFEARPGNLRDAITRFSYAIDLLESFEPKPREFELAFQYRREAEVMLKERIQATTRDAIRAVQLKALPEARDAYRAIMDMTEPGEKDHEQARKIFLMIEDSLRKRR
jgi:hypothetical protein